MKFYKENETESIFLSIEELEEDKYTLIKANSFDAAIEKHVPIYEIKDDKILVRVGEIEHPMLEEHYIPWIALINGNDIIKYDLKPGDKPEATFDYIKGSEIYTYCNMHELWMTKVN